MKFETEILITDIAIGVAIVAIVIASGAVLVNLAFLICESL